MEIVGATDVVEHPPAHAEIPSPAGDLDVQNPPAASKCLVLAFMLDHGGTRSCHGFWLKVGY